MGERIARMTVLAMAIAVASGCVGQEQQMPPPPEAPAAAPATPEPKVIPTAPPVFEEQRPDEAPAAPAAAAEPAPKVAPAKDEGATKADVAKKAAQPSPAATEAQPVEPAASAKPAPAVAGPCGDEDQPPCPLQGWMEKQLQQPFDDDQFAKLAPALERLAKMAPEPSWNAGPTGWATLAEAGAAAAKSADRDALQQTCKGCHKAWRSKYKAGFRTRAIE